MEILGLNLEYWGKVRNISNFEVNFCTSGLQGNLAFVLNKLYAYCIEIIDMFLCFWTSKGNSLLSGKITEKFTS